MRARGEALLGEVGVVKVEGSRVVIEGRIGAPGICGAGAHSPRSPSTATTVGQLHQGILKASHVVVAQSCLNVLFLGEQKDTAGA